jgi:DNA-binding NtrC family response regulator
MRSTNKIPRILIIDPNDNASLRTSLEDKYGLIVSHQANGRTALNTLQTSQPDLVVLNADLSDPPASTLLAELTAQEITLPVVLIGANGKPVSLNYNNIIGWINQPFTAAELASLIHSALESHLPGSDLVLAKRAE